jgi:LacI family transcriptional regulator
MQEIANAAKVSRMAVSLALRNSPKISASTRERIRAAAEKLGYRPNPLVSALMTQLRGNRPPERPSTIAYVTAHPTEDGWRRPGPFVAFFEGAKKRAAQLGYVLEHWWLRAPGLTGSRFCEVLHARAIHGMIVAPLPPGAGADSVECDWPDFAAATIGYSLASPDLHRASNHQYGTIGVALRELARLGYRRIGLAMQAEQDERVQHQWSAGLLVYQQGIAPGDRVPPLLCRGSFARSFAAWLSEHRPDAVLSHDAQTLRLLDRFGLRVPRDIGFAHLALSDGDKGIAGMNQNSELVGAAALDLVDAQLRHNERGIPAVPEIVLVPGFWVAGPTVREIEETLAAPSPKPARAPAAIPR